MADSSQSKAATDAFNTKSVPCARCIKAGQPEYFGSQRQCAFKNGIYDIEGHNWQCATINELRDLCSKESKPCVFSMRDDMRSASIGVIQIPEIDKKNIQQGYLVMTWYKDRGSTGQAWVMCDDNKPTPLTLKTAETIIHVITAATSDPDTTTKHVQNAKES